MMKEQKQIPIYEGMTVLSDYNSESRAEGDGISVGYLSEKMPYSVSFLSDKNGNNGDNGNNGNHYGQHKKPVGEIVEDEDSIGIGIPEQDMYYAQPNQDIYINVHISNPDSFEILSFTLNGKITHRICLRRALIWRTLSSR